MGVLTRASSECAMGKKRDDVDDDDDLLWDEDELLDRLHWMKQGIAVACGVAFGLVPVTGLIGAAAFMALTLFCTYLYYHSVLRVDEDDYGGHNVLLGEGLMPSFFVFQICWITSYSLVQW